MVEVLAEGLRSRGPDDSNTIVRDPMAMAFAAFATTPESRQEKQPLYSRETGCVLTWDGRLDSRGELLQELDLPHTLADSEIVLAVLERHGVTRLRSLIGDYALAFWDARTKELVLARDPMGTRPLWYVQTAASMVWSSELTPLFIATGASRDVDDRFVAGYLSRGTPADRSPYTSVRRVAPGTALVIGDRETREEIFWDPDPEAEILLRSDREYEERFFELFRESLCCRMRTPGAVAAELSGGLDSSSIVVMADEIIRTFQSPARSLESVSYVFDGSPTSDERPFISAVEAVRGRKGHHSSELEHPYFTPVPEEEFNDYPTPYHLFHRRSRDLSNWMGEIGARVLLSGTAGDQICWGEVDTPPEIGDHVRRFGFLAAHRSIRAWQPHVQKPYTQLFFEGAIVPFLPTMIRTRASRASLPKWLAPSFVKKMNLRERILQWDGEKAFSLPSRREAYGSLRDSIAAVSDDYCAGRGFFDVAYPFLHRPLVEFAMAIPIEQHLRPGETRSLVRRAMRDLLPEKVARRTSKQGPAEAIYRAIAREWKHLRLLLDRPRICERGYVKHDAFTEMLQKARHGVNVHAFGLMRILSLEYWLRSIERPLPIAASSPDLAVRPDGSHEPPVVLATTC